MPPEQDHSDAFLHGTIFLHRGNLDGARRCFEDALRGLADVYEARHDTDLARRCAARVSEIQRRYGLPKEEGDVAREARLGIASRSREA
jgi:hypothetical protein